MKYTVKNAKIQYYRSYYWSKQDIDINVNFAKNTSYWRNYYFEPYKILLKDGYGFKHFSDLFYLGENLIQIPITEKQKIKQNLIWNEYVKANNYFIYRMIILSFILCLFIWIRYF